MPQLTKQSFFLLVTVPVAYDLLRNFCWMCLHHNHADSFPLAPTNVDTIPPQTATMFVNSDVWEFFLFPMYFVLSWPTVMLPFAFLTILWILRLKCCKAHWYPDDIEKLDFIEFDYFYLCVCRWMSVCVIVSRYSKVVMLYACCFSNLFCVILYLYYILETKWVMHWPERI